MAQLKEGSVIKKKTGDELIATLADTLEIREMDSILFSSLVGTSRPIRREELDFIENENPFLLEINFGPVVTGMFFCHWDESGENLTIAPFDRDSKGLKLFLPKDGSDGTASLISNDNDLIFTIYNMINNKVKTDVPEGAKFTDTVTTINGKTGTIAKADIVALGIPAQDTVVDISGKADKTYVDGKVKTDVPLNAKFTDTVYSHPSTHPASMITGLPASLPADGGNADTVGGFTVGINVPANAKFTDTNTITTINGKTGAITKADITALGIPAQDTVIDISGKADKTYVDNKVKTDVPVGAKFTDTVYTHPASHPASMITGLPTSLPANGGDATTSKHLVGDDTRSVNSNPSVYMSGGSRYVSRAGWQTEFKNVSTIGLTGLLNGTYCYLQTHTPWSDPTGGYPIQVAYGNGTPCWRVGVSTSAWSAWQKVSDGGNANTVNGFTVGVNVPSNAKFTDTVYSHPTTAGNKHIPTGGASGQVLKYSASGTATWQTDKDTITTINGKTGAISKADIVALGIPSSNSNTTYSEISTAEIDTGTASTLRTVTGRRASYIIGKANAYTDTHEAKNASVNNVHGLRDKSVILGQASNAKGSTVSAVIIGENATGGTAGLSSSGLIAIGLNSDATYTGGIAIGYDSSAINSGTTAIGQNASASELGATALGRNASAEGVTATAIGSDSNAEGMGATAIGDGSKAVGSSATALGDNSNAGDSGATALGRDANAVGSGAIAIGASSNAEGLAAIALGYVTNAGVKNTVSIGAYSTSLNEQEGVLGSGNVNKWRVAGSFTVSGTKNFEIPHPKPEKKSTHKIRHGAVESPTAGDTLYRYKIQATKDNDKVLVDLPDYFIYLNKNVQIFVTGQGHFGNGYGVLNEETEQLEISCQLEGKYNVLVIGTRDDDHQSVQDWNIKGVEREIGESWTGETYTFSVDEIMEVEEIKEELV